MRFIAWQDGRWQAMELSDRAKARELALGPVPVWVRAEDVGAAEWDQLGEWFGLHPLALEDIRNQRQRPKVEDYPGFTFAVLRLPRLDADLVWRQVGVFLGDGFVMTAALDTVPELDEAERRLAGGAARAAVGELDHVFYHVLDVVVDSWFPFMDAVEDRLESLEDQVIDRPDKQTLAQIRDLKGIVSRTRKVLGPLREAVLSAERGNHPNLSKATRLFLRDVSDHAIRLAERLEHVREMAFFMQETWNASLANQQNEAMKRLAVIAFLLLLPTFAAGLGGMNFERGFPDLHFGVVSAVLVAFAVLGLAVSWWRDWI